MYSMEPSDKSAAVTPNDSTQQPVGRTLYVGTGGNITGRLLGDTADRVWKNVPNGMPLPFVFQYIRATGTTAADMIIHF
ncbi:MAG: hypothetical protein E6Q97_23020 [Desulfurellales bacterium]|nr:MAG: hypothetical protein E6Q97_23020 [Desulfurellales bacterium]